MREKDYKEYRGIKFFIFAGEWAVLETLPKSDQKTFPRNVHAGCIQFGETWVFYVNNHYQKTFHVEIVGNDNVQSALDLVDKIKTHLMSIGLKETTFDQALANTKDSAYQN
jgi:hypothetical protein